MLINYTSKYYLNKKGRFCQVKVVKSWQKLAIFIMCMVQGVKLAWIAVHKWDIEKMQFTDRKKYWSRASVEELAAEPGCPMCTWCTCNRLGSWGLWDSRSQLEKNCVVSRDRGVLPRAGYLDLGQVGGVKLLSNLWDMGMNDVGCKGRGWMWRIAWWGCRGRYRYMKKCIQIFGLIWLMALYFDAVRCMLRNCGLSLQYIWVIH